MLTAWLPGSMLRMEEVLYLLHKDLWDWHTIEYATIVSIYYDKNKTQRKWTMSMEGWSNLSPEYVMLKKISDILQGEVFLCKCTCFFLPTNMGDETYVGMKISLTWIILWILANDFSFLIAFFVRNCIFKEILNI